MKYNTIEELMHELNLEVNNSNNEIEKKLLDEFYADKRKEIDFLENHIKDIERGDYKPKSFERINS